MFVGCDFGCFWEMGLFDVVLIEDVFLGGDDIMDMGGDEIYSFEVGGVVRFDEDGGRVNNGVDGFEIGCVYGFIRFYISG